MHTHTSESPTPEDAAPENPSEPGAAGADRHVLIAGHLLFTVLLVIGAIRALANTDSPVGVAIAIAVVAAWYFLGAAWVRDKGLPRQRVWLAVLIVGWLALVVISAEFIWLAFLFAMLVWHLFPMPWSAAGEVLVAVIAVVGFSWHQGTVVAGAVFGPVIGIACAAVMTEVYQRLRAQSEERRRLLDELMRTQQALAVRERETGRLAERERLARDIHDTVGQSLASVILLLRAAIGQAPHDQTHHTQLQTALDTTLTALSETRRFVRGLDPEVIEKHGLRTALEALAAESTALGIPTTFAEYGQPQQIPLPYEVALLRAAQEAVANARSHAHPTAITITLTYLVDEVGIDIIDDGIGFDPADQTGPDAAPRADGSGYGLTAMRGRIHDCGGEVVIESEPGGGTALHAAIPLTDPPQSDHSQPDPPLLEAQR